MRDLIARKKKGQKATTALPVEKDDDKVIDLMEALRRSLAGQGGGSKERAERFLERKKGKAVGPTQTQDQEERCIGRASLQLVFASGAVAAPAIVCVPAHRRINTPTQ